jgi:hypothetical protein
MKKESKSTKKHPGFAKVAEKIEKREGVSKESAAAILASATRKASQAARKENPNLKKVHTKSMAAPGKRRDY